MNRLQELEELLSAMTRSEKAQVLQWVARDLGDAFPGIESIPDVCGGEPCVVRTRIPGWVLVQARRLGPIRKFVKTIKRHVNRILSFVRSRLTNAIAEGLNSIIGIIKNRASGFRTLQAFTDMIFLTEGDLDIPAQIPVKFRLT